MSGRLTTHVLDTAQGRPAVGVTVSLWLVEGEARTLLRQVATNADGRTDGPLLEGAELRPAVYEIVFEVGAYFAGQALAVSAPPFLDAVPVRFSVADGDAHYHVPLLASPWGYTTYRGS